MTRRDLVLMAVVTLLIASPLAAQRPLTAPQREAWERLLQAADARLAADTAAIDAALGARDVSLGRAALRAIGQARVAARYDLLRRALAATDTGAAAEAAFALGIARDSLACAPLRTAFARGGAVGVEAAWSLGELGRGCLPTESMLATAPDVPTRVRALEVAARDRAVPLDLLERFASDTAAPVRVAAWYALSRARRAPSDALLFAAHRDTSTAVHEHAARLLAHPIIGTERFGLAYSLLPGWLAHPHPHVRIAAVRAAATWDGGPSDALMPMLGLYPDNVLRDRDVNVRVAIAQALDTVAMGRDTLLWGYAWRADTTFMVRRSLLTGALRAGVALADFAAWRFDTDWRHRAAVADAAGAAPESLFVAFGLTALDDADGRVRAAAIGAVAARRDSSAARRALLTRLARSGGDLHGRATALGALASRASHDDVPLALDAYRRAADDRESDARLAALRLLAAAWRRDSAAIDAPTRVAIAALPAPSDLLLRAAVADVAPLAAWKHAPRSVRPLAHYRRIVRDYVEPARRGRVAAMRIETERGPIRIALACADVPLTCAVFDSLASSRYWDGARFHRVVPAFVAQDGDPRGDGNGGPGFAIRDELNRRRYVRGAVGMALSGPDTGGSQYFLTLSPQPHLDGRYTVIGTVVAGDRVMDALVQGDAIRELRVVR